MLLLNRIAMALVIDRSGSMCADSLGYQPGAPPAQLKTTYLRAAKGPWKRAELNSPQVSRTSQ